MLQLAQLLPCSGEEFKQAWGALQPAVFALASYMLCWACKSLQSSSKSQLLGHHLDLQLDS